MSEIRVDSITDEVGTSSPDFPNGILKSSLPAGSVIQVVSTTKTDTFSAGQDITNGFTDITGMSVSITPASTNSEILVLVSCALGATNNFGYIRLARDATPIFIGDSSGSRPRVSAMSFDGNINTGLSETLAISHLDSPSTTSSITYKLQLASPDGDTMFINRSTRDLNAATNDTRQASSITVMEIAG